MKKKDYFSKQDPENQAKNILLNLDDESFEDYINNPFQQSKENQAMKQNKKHKYNFFQRAQKQKQKRRFLRQLNLNSNSDMRISIGKKIRRKKPILTSQKPYEYPIQNIKQLKSILQKLQSKQIKTKQQFTCIKKDTVKFQNNKRSVSVNNKKRNLSFINNKSQNKFLINYSNKMLSNLGLLKKNTSKQPNCFFDQNFPGNGYQINHLKKAFDISLFKDTKNCSHRFQAHKKANVDSLSTKTLNILHQINNYKSINCKRRQRSSIKNNGGKTSNPQHFFSVRI